MLIKEAKKWLEIILFERFGLYLNLLITNNNIELHHGNSSNYIIFDSMLPSFLDFKKIPCCNWDVAAENWKPVLEKTIPAPGISKISTPLVKVDQGNYIVHYDILGLTFWVLSRQEELITTQVDDHNRFPATASHAYEFGYLDRPIVDEWLHILGQIIKHQWPQVALKKHQFSMQLSHDVDAPSRYAFMKTSKFIRILVGRILRCDFKSLLLAFKIREQTKTELISFDPFNTFDFIMDLSEKHNIQSAFYFICGRTSLKNDADYELEHPAIRNIMKHIYNRGHEIGLHPSYNTYKNKPALISEAVHLRKVCAEEGIMQSQWGGRMHYLRWETPTTLQGWENASMSYDSTLGYADRAGFRCGTCFEYPSFDLENKKMLNLRIRPLIAMECTVIAKRYMGLGYSNESLETFLFLKETCKKVNGTFTLLWHNSHLVNQESRVLYSKILNH